jgi:hypothetical protein
MAAAIPHPDKIEINSIVTTRLWSKKMADIVEPMTKLKDLLDTSYINAENNRKTAFRRGVVVAIAQTMHRFKNSIAIHIDDLGILVNLSWCKWKAVV